MTSGYTLRQRWYSQHPEHSGLWPRKGWQCLYPSFIHTGPAWWVAHSRGSGNSPSELTRTHTHTHALPHRKAHSFIFPVGVFYASPLNFPLSPSHGSSVVCRPFVAAHPSSLKTCTIPWLQEGGEEGVSEATLHPPPHIHCFGSTEACQMLDTVVPDPHGSSLFPGVALGRLPQFPHLCFIELMLGGK